MKGNGIRQRRDPCNESVERKRALHAKEVGDRDDIKGCVGRIALKGGDAGTQRCHWSATRMGMRPRPPSSGRRAFPITAPNAWAGFAAFIACPGVAEVVSKSPTQMGVSEASTLQ